MLQEPTPYRSPHLARIAADPDLAVSVVYAARTVQRRTWSHADDHAIYLRGGSLPLSRVLHHDYPLTPGIWPLLGRLRPDVVVIGGWSTSATQLAILWCRVRHVPYLLTSDNHLRERRPGWVRALKRVVLPRIVPQAAGWLVPGTLAREHAIAYGADPARVVDFPLTVDVPQLVRRAEELRARRDELRAALGITPETVLVLSVGRLIELKAPEILLRATARATEALEQPLHLTIAGEGPLEEPLRRAADALGLRVTFAGHAEGGSLLELYAAADVFALLSRREPWAVVVNEAMSFGLPLVLTNAVGAAADLLEPGRNGLLVPADDVEAAADAIARLARDPGLRRSFGEASRALIEPWGYERGSARLSTLLREVTAGR